MYAHTEASRACTGPLSAYCRHAEVWVKSARLLCATIIYAPLKPRMFAARLTMRYSNAMMEIGANEHDYA